MIRRARAPPAGPDIEGFEREADMVRVLANPKRLMIVDLLGRGPCSVTEIADWLDLSLQNASQHLRVMKDQGIVRARREGRVVRYAIRNPVLSQSCKLVREALLAESPRRSAPLAWERGLASGPARRRTAGRSRARHLITVAGERGVGKP